MVVTLLALALLATFPSTRPEDISQVLPLAPDGRIYLRTHTGTVEVNGWNRPEVRIDARLESRGLVRIAACDEKPRLSVDAWPASVRVTITPGAARDSQPWWLAACSGRPVIHYRLWVPRGAALTIVDEASRIRVAGVARVYLRRGARE